MAPEAAPIIAFRHVTYRFADGSIGLDDIDLNIFEGEVVLFIGPNGSGKTTLFRHLIGLLLPQEGEIFIEGKEVRKNLRYARERIGMVFQDADCQIVGETVAGDVAFGPENLRLDRIEIESRVHDALKAVGLIHYDNRRPHTLSGGEKRRLAIAGILAMKPQILVLDEPFANLDYPAIRSVVSILTDLVDQGVTLLISSHQIDPLLPLVNRIVLLSSGKVLASSSPQEVLSKAEALGVLPDRLA